MIVLEKLEDETDIKAFWEATVAQYVHDLMMSLNLNEAEAKAKSRRDMDDALEIELAAPGRYFFSSHNAITHENVGAIWVTLEEDIRTAWLQYILVYPQYREQGYGTAMLRALSEWVCEIGCDQINLSVYAHNAVARNLYRKIGFRSSAEIMRLSLAAN